MLLVLDNYDSFTYNLVQYLGELGAQMEVHRNDQISVDAVLGKKPDAIVISPGPCTPNEAGISVELIKRAGPEIPLLGVCLGHQAIGQAFGGNVIRAPEIMHGKTSPIHHKNEGLFAGVENPMTATRYHSLIVERGSLPDCLMETAWTEKDGQRDLIMGLRHKTHPIYGVQFHPESILTAAGKKLLANFLAVRR